MPAASFAIRVRDLKKSYRLYPTPRDRLKELLHPFGKQYHTPFNALEGISFEISQGAAIGLIGRNGSGKSTLLQCLCGVVTPTGGQVEVQGKIAALLELGAGFNPEFTGRENLYLNAAILGLSQPEIEQRLDSILAFAEIGPHLDQPLKTYSSGMYVRLAFSIAIHVDPEILIVDEALAVGDSEFQAKCFNRFHRFREQGVTIVFVTHDLNMATRYCDTALLLSHGRLVGQGHPKDVVAQYRKLESGFKPTVPTRPDRAKVPPADRLSEDRYGNHRAHIRWAAIHDRDGQTVTVLQGGEPYRIEMQVRFEEAIENPVFAYTIKDLKGTEITGTNTDYHGMQTGRFGPGEVAHVRFEQVIPLSAGRYLLSLGCVALGGDQVEVLDRRHDMIAFEVVSDRACVGIVDLDARIVVARDQPDPVGLIR